MTTTVGYHCAFKAVRRRERKLRVGRLWNDEDFTFLKLDKYDVDAEVLEREKKENNFFHVWKEG